MPDTPDTRPGGLTAVVADDSAAMVETITAALEAVGIDALGVHSGDALERLVLARARGGEAPDVVVTDVYMPDGSGLDVSARLLESLPHLPIIIVSAFASEHVRAHARRIGVRRVLSKPVAMRELQQVVLAELA